jgi:hypothetical protein
MKRDNKFYYYERLFQNFSFGTTTLDVNLRCSNRKTGAKW